MKKLINILFVTSLMVLGIASCSKKESYVPAKPEDGARVYFITLPSSTVKLTKENPEMQIEIGRNSKESALEATLTVVGDDAKTYFNIPTSVAFAAGEEKAMITVAAKDVDAMPMNEFYDLSITVQEDLQSLYGLANISFKVGIELPWIVFDKAGTMIEGWWGETEPGMPMKYQQISATLRYCMVEGCWGHDTIAKGEPYEVQPYVWYWNTETNACYVPCQYMGYSTDKGDAYISDEPAFYNWYWNSQTPGKNGSGLEQGTAEWFEWCDARRAAWEGDPFPYYDGAGKFYLGDWGFYVTPGTTAPTGSGFQFGGKQDQYVCSFAADYTIGVSFDGFYYTKEQETFVVGSLVYEGADAEDVTVLIVPGKDAETVVANATEILEDTESVYASMLTVSKAGEFRLPMIEDAEDGFYSLLAIPLNEDGEYEWDYAFFDSFSYGEVDPLYLEYTSNDFIDYVSKEKLLGTEWVAFATSPSGTPSDREAYGTITFEDGEDTDPEVDLIIAHGFTYGADEYFGFPGDLDMEWYGGFLYTLANDIKGKYADTYDVVPTYVSDDQGAISTGNYAMIGTYVEEGIIALVSNSDKANFTQIWFGAYQNDQLADYFCAMNYILLVDPDVVEVETGEKVAAKAMQKLSSRLNPSAASFQKGAPAIVAKDRFVKGTSVASGKLSVKARELQNVNLR